MAATPPPAESPIRAAGHGASSPDRQEHSPPATPVLSGLLAPPRVHSQRDLVADRRLRRNDKSVESSPRAVVKTREIIEKAKRAIPEKRRISRRSHFTVSPFEKFRRYGRFPCKLVLNVIIFALMMALLLGCHMEIAKSEESQRKTLVALFMPEDFLDPSVNYYRYPTTHYGTIDELRSFLKETTNNYYSITNLATAEYQHWTKEGVNGTHNATESDILPLVMEAKVRIDSGRLSPSPQSFKTMRTVMTPEDPYGLFGVLPDSVKNRLQRQENYARACAPRIEAVDWDLTPTTTYYDPCRRRNIDNNIFDVASEVTVTIRLRSSDTVDVLTMSPSVYDWEVVHHIDFNPNGLITITLTARSTLYRTSDTVTPWIGVAIATLVFLVWDFLLRLKALLRIKRIKAQRRREAEEFKQRLERSRRRHDEEHRDGCSTESNAAESSSSSSTSTEDDPEFQRAVEANKWKVDLRNSMGKSWTQWALFSDVVNIAFVLDMLLGTVAYSQPWWLRYTMSIAGGLGGFAICTLFVSYIRFFPKLYVLMVATNVAVPHFLRFFVTVIPIYAAFGFFGVILFGDYAPEFSTFGEAVTSLYCAVFGDSLLQMFQVTGATDVQALKQIGWLYSAAFISFFIYAVLNIATAIILGAYTYVNETYNVHTSQAERRVAPQKTAQEQLDDALEEAQASLRKVARLMDDDRNRHRTSPTFGQVAGGSFRLNGRQLQRTADDTDMTGVSMPAVAGDNGDGAAAADPMASYLDDVARLAADGPIPVVEVQASSTSDGTSSGTSSSSNSHHHRRHRRHGRQRRRGATNFGAVPPAVETESFFAEEWVDRDVIF